MTITPSSNTTTTIHSTQPTHPFTHLNLHTYYSIMDGLISIDQLINTAQSLNMPAIAITDQNNLFGFVKFYRTALKHGIKPIIGTDITLTHSQECNSEKTHSQECHSEKNHSQKYNSQEYNHQQEYNPQQSSTSTSNPFKLTLLCQNQQGYQNLSQLLSKAYQEGQENGSPRLNKHWLSTHNTQGLIALSGGQQGDVGQALLKNQLQVAEKQLKAWQQLFGDRFYIEIQRINQPNEAIYIQSILPLAEKHQIPVVATNAVRFLTSDDFEAHEARVCIHRGETLQDEQRQKHYTPAQYLRSAQDMQTLFSDIPEALANTVEITKRCNFELELGHYHMPQYPLPTDTTIEKYFNEKAYQGLIKRHFPNVDSNKASSLQTDENSARYLDRLNMELGVINKMGFSAYFLIVADFVGWAKSQNIPVGPGRGSGSGSLVAYALGITDIDPMPHNLLFERFLNPERISMPDFDIDFCMEGRDQVIDYVIEKFGRDNVAQIITYGTMAAKAVVRDIGRVMGYPYGFVDKLAKLIPFEVNMTLRKALRQEPLLRQRFQDEEDVNTLIKLAIKLEGTPRNVSTHAGGVVIAPTALTNFTPLYCEPGGKHTITQLDKDDLDAIGLVKFDFLGLRTLTIIQWTVEQVNKTRQAQNLPNIDITQLPLDDKKTYELLQSCQTTAIFQLESHGIKDLIKRLQPKCFDDIAVLGALYRPGPLQSGMVDELIQRRDGQIPMKYLHPKLENILKETYGVILYQEQVLKIAQLLAGYTLGRSDFLRKAMGKKQPEEMIKHRSSFVEGAAKHAHVDPKLANKIFDLMEKFAGYGFNKSHAVAYAMLTYQTAWLKAHYPAYFMASVLSSDMDNTDKVVKLINECRQLGIDILPPNINQSDYKFTVHSDNTILYGLGAIKGVGQSAISLITKAQSKATFKSLDDLCQRVDTRRVNRASLEALILSGALDCFEMPRETLLAHMSTALKMAEQQATNLEKGQTDLFAGDQHSDSVNMPISTSTLEEKNDYWTEHERLKQEKSVLGFYLSGHPIRTFRQELKSMGVTPLHQINPNTATPFLTAGYVATIRTKLSKKRQKKMAFVSLDDDTGRMDLSLFSEAYEKFQALLVKDQLLIAKGSIRYDEFTNRHKINAEHLYTLAQVRSLYAKCVQLHLSKARLSDNFIQALKQILTAYKGGACHVIIYYRNNKAAGKIHLGEPWKVTLTEALMDQLNALCGTESVMIQYHHFIHQNHNFIHQNI